MTHTPMRLEAVEPQPDWIESSGRWRWPLPPRACFPGCCTSVVTASREWWEYAPSEAKPHPMAEGVRLRDDIWYWAIPFESLVDFQRQELGRMRVLLAAMCGWSELLAEQRDWTRENAGSFWASYDAARVEAPKSYEPGEGVK